MPEQKQIGHAKHEPQDKVDDEFSKFEKELSDQMGALVANEGV
mgnify:CR=1 FL=1